MANYLRRIIVPYAKRTAAWVYLKTLVDEIREENVLINKQPFTIFKILYPKPVLVQLEVPKLVPGGTIPTQAVVLSSIAASDLDIQGSLLVDPTDLAAVVEETEGNYEVTVTVTDPWGGSNTVEAVIRVTDGAFPTITLTATAVDVAAANVAAFDPADNIATAVDAVDDVSASVVFAYRQDDAEGTVIADLAGAKTYLGTEGNVVFVTYNYSDGLGNPATERTASFTAVA